MNYINTSVVMDDPSVPSGEMTKMICTCVKKLGGFICVGFFYILMNLHIYFFVDLYLLNFAFNPQQTMVVSIVMTFIGMYLHMRVFIVYTLCMFKNPISMLDKKKEKINYDRIREGIIKQCQLSEKDAAMLRMYRSDFGGLQQQLGQTQNCKKCQMIKPLRVRHCRTCGQCVIRMDHHCILVNNCIGLHNHIYLIQLMFHLALGSVFYFIMILQMSSNDKVYSQILGSPLLWLGFHGILGLLTATYTVFLVWEVSKDQTTIEYMQLNAKEEAHKVVQFEPKALATNLLLISRQTTLFKALFYPYLLPINGLEYEYERLQGRTTKLSEIQ